MCIAEHRFSLVEPPTTQIYGAIFIIFAVIAGAANMVALYALWAPGHISKSNKILISLAISDMFTGIIGFPISAYEILSPTQKNNCYLETFRTFVSLVLTGSSVLTLALISFDRYLLLTKYSRYDQIMSNRTMSILLLLCWIYPGVTPSLKFTGSTYPYLASLVLIFYGPIIFIITFYFLLIREIYRSDKQLQSHGQQHSSDVSSSSSRKTSTVIAAKRSAKRHLKTARAVAVLLACYCICLAPFNLWLIFNILNGFYGFISAHALQQWYLFGITVGGWNSCINPFVYLSKQPAARKKLLLLYKSKTKQRKFDSNTRFSETRI